MFTLILKYFFFVKFLVQNIYTRKTCFICGGIISQGKSQRIRHVEFVHVSGTINILGQVQIHTQNIYVYMYIYSHIYLLALFINL